MERWEYQVIHLNVEPPAPAPPSAPPAAPPGVDSVPDAPPRVEGVFSKAYLEKEFPGFYGAQPQVGAPASEHPANQLRGFLDLQGRDGWQLVGFYPVGRLTMMIFRRPLTPVPVEDAQDAAAPVPALGDPGPDGVSDPTAAGSVSPDAQAALLQRILERLEALERRLPSPSSVDAGVQPLPAGEAAVGPAGLAALRDGAILSPQCWGLLEGLPRLSTSEAARALGFRSAASLLNLAARSGYPPGLVKRGADATLAVYVGSERSGRGGRDRRLWVVLRAPAA